mmetsp:Transcript_26512/g.39455  ORF Transcript_26512/g.39455 Transcript_26512/m.39455 type:complete len:80 (-) Transcript_26512:271-510(-)
MPASPKLGHFARTIDDMLSELKTELEPPGSSSRSIEGLSTCAHGASTTAGCTLLGLLGSAGGCSEHGCLKPFRVFGHVQ